MNLKLISKHWFLAISLVLTLIYLLLTFKDPFSQRTLIPNLEPFPDTLFYSVPALNFTTGKSFSMSAYGFSINNIVPPLYSLYLVPFYLLVSDVRMYFVANLVLGLSSLWLFLVWLKKIAESFQTQVNASRSWLLVLLGGFGYVTTFHIYNLPSLLMAENLTLLLSIAGLWLLVSKANRVNSVLSGMIGLLLLLVKFSNFPIALAFHLAYLWRLLEKRSLPLLKLHLSTVAASALVFVAFIKLSGILQGHVNLSQGSGFGVQYLSSNFRFYWQTLTGGLTRLLWYQELLVSSLVGWLGVIGLGLSLVISKKEVRAQSLKLILFVISVVGFMSSFYYPDARYVMVLLLPLVYGFVFLIHQLTVKVSFKALLIVVVAVVATDLLLTQPAPFSPDKKIIALKKQLGLNFKHAQQPWNYLAINHIFKAVDETASPATKPYLGTFLPPFYVSIFSDESSHYLPLGMGQEFSAQSKNMLQHFYQGYLYDHYQQLVESGEQVFVSNYYTNSSPEWRANFEQFKNRFELELVAEGCFGGCNVYQVKVPSES